MQIIKKFFKWLSAPYRKWKSDREWKQKLKKLRERDPFIYK